MPTRVMLKSFQERVKDNWIHAVIGLGIVFAVLGFKLAFKEISWTDEAIYIFLGEIFLFLTVINRNILGHGSDVKDYWEREQRPILSDIRNNLKSLVNYSENEKNILKCIEERKTQSNGEFKAIWCIDYNDDKLNEYFTREKELLNKKHDMVITRLINTNFPKSKIRSHLDIYKDYILEQKYILYSTEHNEFELLLCHDFSAIDGNFQEMVAIQIFKGAANDRTPKLAVYSHDTSFTLAMKNLFTELELRGKKLDIQQSDNFAEKRDEWLTSFR
jgi:hypothetical protein